MNMSVAGEFSFMFNKRGGSEGSEMGESNTIHTIAIDSINNLYVDDSNNGRIQKFDINGRFITEWMSPWR
jgi:tripartite motif-containing protein 71